MRQPLQDGAPDQLVEVTKGRANDREGEIIRPVTLGLKPNATSRLNGRHWAQDCHRLLRKRFDPAE